MDEEYTDSQRLDEMLTAEDYNRFEEEQIARDHDLEQDEQDDPGVADEFFLDDVDY